MNAGCFYPATSLPSVNIMSLTKSVGKIMYDKGIIGHIAIDLVVFPNPTDAQGAPLFWAVDLNCQLTDYAAACFMFDILMEGELDEETGDYKVMFPDGDEEDELPPETLAATKGSSFKKPKMSMADAVQ